MFEAVQIQIKYAEPVAVASGCIDGMLDSVVEKTPVGQARKFVVIRQLFNGFLCEVQLGVIDGRTDKMRDGALLVPNRRDMLVSPYNLYCMRAQEDYTTPLTRVAQCRQHILRTGNFH